MFSKQTATIRCWSFRAVCRVWGLFDVLFNDGNLVNDSNGRTVRVLSKTAT